MRRPDEIEKSSIHRREVFVCHSAQDLVGSRLRFLEISVERLSRSRPRPRPHAESDMASWNLQ